MLYKKIEIPNFDLMQKELQGLVIGKFADQSQWSVYDPTLEEMADRCPLFHNYILSKSLMPLRFYRIYSTPGNGKLNPHIDGGQMHKSPLGLNVPIHGCTNSVMKWFDGSNASIINGYFGYGGLPACRILNEHELKCTEQIEVDRPTFVRTDFIHSVENYNNTPRVLLSVRWAYTKTKGKFFDQVWDFS